MKTSRKEIKAEAEKYRRMELGAIENAEAQRKAGFHSNAVLFRMDAYRYNIEAARLESLARGK